MAAEQSEKKSVSWLKFSSTRNFYPLAASLIPWFMGLAILLTLVGLYMTFFVVPPDYQQGNSYRIMYIHVPAAWMSMFIYFLMAIYAAIYFVLNVKLADMMAGALAVSGAIFTFIDSMPCILSVPDFRLDIFHSAITHNDDNVFALHRAI